MRFGFPLKSLSSLSGLESRGGVNCDSSGRPADRVDGAAGIRFAKGNEIVLVREAESQPSVGRATDFANWICELPRQLNPRGRQTA